MLVDPSLDDLLDKVDNKFKLVTLAMKRARQINDGRPAFMEESNAARPVSIALQEINQGTVYVKERAEGEEPEAERLHQPVEVDEVLARIARDDEERLDRAQALDIGGEGEAEAEGIEE